MSTAHDRITQEIERNLQQLINAPPTVPKQTNGDGQAEANAKGQFARPIDGAAVLDDVHAFLGRFVSYPSEDAHCAHTLWIAQTHLMRLWDNTPRLAFLSPEPASGKTRALEISELLVNAPVMAVSVTASFLFRRIAADEKAPPTILYDEIDTVFGPRAKDNEDIRALLNAGHRRGTGVGRSVMVGNRVETEYLPAFAPVALAGLGWLPDTIMTRSVVIRMRPRLPGEPIEPFRRRNAIGEAQKLHARLQAWADKQEEVAGWPELPDPIQDRDADVWEPLIVVADRAGGLWPERARVAAVSLVTANRDRETSLGIRLLMDCKTVFDALPGTRALFSKTILARLHNEEESPWADLRGRPLDERGLGRRLREYGIKPKTVRQGDGDGTSRGYRREDFEDAWNRYTRPPLPRMSDTSDTSDTSKQNQRPFVSEAAAASDTGETTSDDIVSDVSDTLARSSEKTANNFNDVSDVSNVSDFRGRREASDDPDDDPTPFDTGLDPDPDDWSFNTG
jgi:hypothetical protein